MNNNLGLIITASDMITLNTSSDDQEKLKREYLRRESNGKMVTGMFNRNNISPVVVSNVTYETLRDTIEKVFMSADSRSVSYIYINCHGNTSGLAMVLRGPKTVLITYTQLKSLLDTIPGMKVLMIESCQSGESITRTRSLSKKTPEDVNRAIINTFVPNKANLNLKTGELRANNYLVITACHGDESAWGNTSGNYFTKSWCKGAGWDYGKSMPTKRYADTNHDGFVSLKDLCDYTSQKTYDNKQHQNDMCYPENTSFPVFGDVPVCTGPRFVTSENPTIDAYYKQHGGETGIYGFAVGPVETVSGTTVKYQNFMGGVIVQYADGRVAGHTTLKYLLNHIRQTGRIRDGYTDYSLEMYVVVKMWQNDMCIENSKRWPDYSKRKHGGKEFDIIYEGKAVGAGHPQNANVFYDSFVLNGESHIYLNVEVWDYDRTNPNDHIRTYSFDFNIENGWGFDGTIPLSYSQKTASGNTVEYKDVYVENNKIKLDFSIKSFG